MHFTDIAAQVTLLAAATLPAVVNGAIALGNQIREGGTHYNIAWVEGISPCQGGVAIAPESENQCNQNFDLNGEKYYLVGCSGDEPYLQDPARLRREADDSLYGTCSRVDDKEIGCDGSVHNVRKRYLCG